MAGTRFCKFLGSGFALMFALQSAALAESLLQEGESLYSAGNYGKAAECLQRELSRNPYDPQVHYMLGNCFSECRRYSDAAREYNAAIAIQPQGTVADYCRTALARQGNTPTISNVQSPQPKKATESHASTAHNPAPDQSETKQMQGSAERISTQSKEHEDRYTAECEARIRDVNRDLDQQIDRILQEMNENLAAPSLQPYVTGNGRGRSIRLIDGSRAPNELIKAEYQKKIDEAKEKAGEKIASLKATLKTQQMATEDSAITIDRDYVNRKQQANVKIAPSGTNIFVRNYETADDPSGNAVPIALPPAKPLQPVKELQPAKASAPTNKSSASPSK